MRAGKSEDWFAWPASGRPALPRRSDRFVREAAAAKTADRLFLRPADQVGIWVLIVALWSLLAATAYQHGGERTAPASIDQAAPRTLRGGLDINRADWSLLAALPGVGETLARRMVAFREQRGAFSRLEDLRQVPGMGPRTLEAIRGSVHVGGDRSRRGSQSGLQD